MTWLAHILGVDDMSGHWYAWWSGAGSDLGEFGIIAALVANIRRHTCHVHGCWRIGRYLVEGTAHVVCRVHHPDDHLTPQRLAQDTARATTTDRSPT
jgi:hypothetical protein